MFISSLCMDSLVTFDGNKNAENHLAKRIEYINDTTVEIEVREGIKWATDPDGLFVDHYFDIRDVYFTFYVLRRVSCDLYPYRWLGDTEIVDDITMRIYVDEYYEEGYAPLIQYLDLPILPEHYLNQTQLEDGVTPDIFHPSWNTFATHCFGTGLFEIDSFTPNIETVLAVRPDSWWLDSDITNDEELNWVERFGDFSGGLDQLRIRIIEDENVETKAFEDGNIDLISISSNYFKRQKYQESNSFTIQNKLGNAFEFIVFNLQDNEILDNFKPALGDSDITKGLAVRKAICYAINRNELNRIFYGGDAYINHWLIHPTLSTWCKPDIIKYNYDLTKAKTYMEIAGYDIPDFTIPAGTNIYSLTVIFTIVV